MTRFLDSERLNGPQVARISARPRRLALPLRDTDLPGLAGLIELECQIWGGGANVILPINDAGSVSSIYREILPGSQIDSIHGMDYDPTMSLKAQVDLSRPRDVLREQLAIGLLPFRSTEKSAPLEVVSLASEDPWHGIYLASLGSLPESVDPDIIRSGNWLPDISFDDFVEVRRTRTVGSLEDLLSRVWPKDRVLTPRQMSMIKLSRFGTSSAAIRSDRPVLPQPWFSRYDAGPNILVVCSPGSVDDLALLWNLRAAHGDFYSVPIGLPSDELSASMVEKILHQPGLARHGISATTLYVTSLSLSMDELAIRIDGLPGVSICPPSEILTFGSILGLSRDEILVWNEGRASFKPIDPATYRGAFERCNLNELLMLQFDFSVESSPLPISDDYRVDAYNGHFYNGAQTTWSSPRGGERISSIDWPSRGLMASSLASVRDLELSESAPGIAARILVEMIGGLDSVGLLCHGPLLTLMESMAARQGFNWYKDRLRRVGSEASPGESVGSSIDELPEKSFHDFKRVLGNSDAAAKYWLAWAERSSVVIKGFPLQCPSCGAKQWVPVGNFSPPVSCRGCSRLIPFPFGDRPSIDFKYRLSEPARRVYEVDALGHILAARYFNSIFGFGDRSDCIGMHPGMSVFEAGEKVEIGEADLLILTRRGEFIPVEVKRSIAGLNDTELKKLDVLASVLRSPWSGVVACEYTRNSVAKVEALGIRNVDGTHSRVVLTYDSLLQSFPVWTMGDDPFAPISLSEEDIAKREEEYVAALVGRSKNADSDWLAYAMLRRRGDSDN